MDDHPDAENVGAKIALKDVLKLSEKLVAEVSAVKAKSVNNIVAANFVAEIEKGVNELHGKVNIMMGEAEAGRYIQQALAGK